MKYNMITTTQTTHKYSIYLTALRFLIMFRMSMNIKTIPLNILFHLNICEVLEAKRIDLASPS